MKKALCLMICAIILVLQICSIISFASPGEGGAYSQLISDEITSGEEIGFKNARVEACYKIDEWLYANVSFENIVDEFKLVMAAYSDDGVLCAAKVFDISYEDSYYELKMDANGGGDVIKLFFWESVEGLVPICEVNVCYIATEYGYLTDVNKEDNEFKFEIFTLEGKLETFECAEDIVIDESSCIDGDNKVETLLKISAESANENYEDEVNASYHQPVMYKTNTLGEIVRIDTVVSSVNPKISKTIKDDEGDCYYASYGYSKFNLSSCTIADFKVGSKTKVIFVPDDRDNTVKYKSYNNYCDIFFHNESYHYETYGLSEENVASLILVYKENNNELYYNNCETMIVESKTLISASGTRYIAGYTPGSNALKHVYVADEVEISRIGKGDIIRYKTNNKSEMTDFMIWYDASDSIQSEFCEGIEKAIENRILELNVTGKTMTNYPRASYRLQYGTVCDIALSKEGGTIKVTPSIKEDNFDMVLDGDGVVEWEIPNDIKIYGFDGEKVTGNAELTTIKKGETEVIAYSASGKLRAIYIINKADNSEKTIK